MNCKTKLFMKKRKAFTLIELLIVIAIIGILFIVLVSKVDFATDKAKATGVQTDFRSFQMAFDTVAKENAGFNTFGWDTGDANQDGIRNSYDEGDTNKDGVQNGTEVFTGHKVYAETFTKVYSLKKNGTGDYDRDALNRLEAAINANLDPKLHITIKDDGEIVMANGAQDPWNKEYHGYYITNAETDKKDRGAIVMYSDGANNKFGSEHKIANGIVTISIPGNNTFGKDDYSIISCYTYLNGYGEVKNITTGFSNNQSFLGNLGSNQNVNIEQNDPLPEGSGETPDVNNGANSSMMGTFRPNENVIQLVPGMYKAGSNYTVLLKSWEDILAEGILTLDANGVLTNGYSYYFSTNKKATALQGDLILPNDGSIKELGLKTSKYGGPSAFAGFSEITSVVLPEGITTIPAGLFYECRSLQYVYIPEGVTFIGADAFCGCWNLYTLVIPSTVTNLADNTYICGYCSGLVEVVNLSSLNIEQDYRNTMLSVYPQKLISSFTDSTMKRDQNDFVWYEQKDGTMQLRKVFSTASTIRLPESYNGKSYTIVDWAMMHNSTLEHLYIGNGVDGVDQDFVKKCFNIKTITIEQDRVLPLLYENRLSFDECSMLEAIYVPADLVDDYQAAEGWSKFADLIKPIQ